MGESPITLGKLIKSARLEAGLAGAFPVVRMQADV